MRCIKTGFNFIRQSHMDVLRGDLFEHAGALIVVAHEQTSTPLDELRFKDKYTILLVEGVDNGQVTSHPVYVLDVNQIHMTSTMLALVQEHLDLSKYQRDLVLPNMKI